MYFIHLSNLRIKYSFFCLLFHLLPCLQTKTQGDIGVQARLDFICRRLFPKDSRDLFPEPAANSEAADITPLAKQVIPISWTKVHPVADTKAEVSPSNSFTFKRPTRISNSGSGLKTRRIGSETEAWRGPNFFRSSKWSNPFGSGATAVPGPPGSSATRSTDHKPAVDNLRRETNGKSVQPFRANEFPGGDRGTQDSCNTAIYERVALVGDGNEGAWCEKNVNSTCSQKSLEGRSRTGGLLEEMRIIMEDLVSPMKTEVLCPSPFSQFSAHFSYDLGRISSLLLLVQIIVLPSPPFYFLPSQFCSYLLLFCQFPFPSE
jgi:hypothetical protein